MEVEPLHDGHAEQQSEQKPVPKQQASVEPMWLRSKNNCMHSSSASQCRSLIFDKQTKDEINFTGSRRMCKWSLSLSEMREYRDEEERERFQPSIFNFIEQQ